MRFRDAYDPFRAISGAVRLIQAAPLTILTGAILVVVTHPTGGLQARIGNEVNGPQALFLVLFSLLIALVLLLLNSLFYVGFATAVERVAVTGEDQIGDLFRPRGRLWTFLLTSLLTLLALIVGLVPFLMLAGGLAAVGLLLGSEEAAVALGLLGLVIFSPAYIYITLGVLLAPYAAAFERMGPFEALSRSWGLVKGNRLWLFWYLLVQTVFVLLGLLLCCVGIIVTSAVSIIAGFEAYLRLVRDDHASWSIEGGAGAPMGSIEPDGTGDSSW